jgi:hypothetical protein
MACMILTACSPKIADKISWQSKPVIIDGRAIEYQNMRNYINETKMAYSLSNNRKNLYLCLKTSDENMQRKIIRAGMEIWIDTTTKAKKQIGILYPLANIHKTNLGEFQVPMNNERKMPDITKIKQKFALEQTSMELIGFKHNISGLMNIEDKSGIKVKLNWDSTNTMIYEIVVPLKTFYRETISNSDSTKSFILTIDVNGIAMPKMQQGDRPGGGDGPGSDGPGGGGMQDGGGMQGAPPRGSDSMGNMGTIFEKNTFTKKFRLAVKEL